MHLWKWNERKEQKRKRKMRRWKWTKSRKHPKASIKYQAMRVRAALMRIRAYAIATFQHITERNQRQMDWTRKMLLICGFFAGMGMLQTVESNVVFCKQCQNKWPENWIRCKCDKMSPCKHISNNFNPITMIVVCSLFGEDVRKCSNWMHCCVIILQRSWTIHISRGIHAVCWANQIMIFQRISSHYILVFPNQL